MPINSGNFRKGQSGNPKGKPFGAKDKYPRTAKRAILQLLEEFGNNTQLIGEVLTRGLQARAPSSFPYLKLIVEQQVGMPDQTLTLDLARKVIHELHPAETKGS